MTSNGPAVLLRVPPDVMTLCDSFTAACDGEMAQTVLAALALRLYLTVLASPSPALAVKLSETPLEELVVLFLEAIGPPTVLVAAPTDPQ